MVVILLMKIAYTDFKTKTIRNEMPALLLAAGFLSIWIMPEILFRLRIAGLFIVSVPLLILAYFVPGSIGGGDIKLMAAGGFLLGVSGIWNAFETGIMICGLFVGIFLMSGRLDRNAEVALGPYLCLGMMVEWLKF